jgi:hypothetical protein
MIYKRVSAWSNDHSVGPKTADYLKILVGLPCVAMDLRLFRFVELAGIGKLNYEQVQEVIHRTADRMGLGRNPRLASVMATLITVASSSRL